jgi:hypothetical protein
MNGEIHLVKGRQEMNQYLKTSNDSPDSSGSSPEVKQ